MRLGGLERCISAFRKEPPLHGTEKGLLGWRRVGQIGWKYNVSRKPNIGEVHSKNGLRMCQGHQPCDPAADVAARHSKTRVAKFFSHQLGEQGRIMCGYCT